MSEADLAAFEARMDGTLPSDYRLFLLAVNGGDGPVDDSGYPVDRYFTLHWLGGPISEADLAGFRADPMGWAEIDDY